MFLYQTFRTKDGAVMFLSQKMRCVFPMPGKTLDKKNGPILRTFFIFACPVHNFVEFASIIWGGGKKFHLQIMTHGTKVGIRPTKI